MIRRLLHSPPLRYVAVLLLLSLLFGLANNFLRSPESRMGLFDGQEILEGNE